MEPTLGSFYCPYGWCVRMPITGHMAGIAIDARIATNIAKLPELLPGVI
jgi:hypothetical protein